MQLTMDPPPLQRANAVYAGSRTTRKTRGSKAKFYIYEFTGVDEEPNTAPGWHPNRKASAVPFATVRLSILIEWRTQKTKATRYIYIPIDDALTRDFEQRLGKNTAGPGRLARAGSMR